MSMVEELVFHAEPPPVRRASRWDSVREELMANPGMWAVVYESSKTQTHHVRTSLGDGFEIATRQHPDGMVHTWARFVGGAA